MNNIKFTPNLDVEFLTFSDGAEHVQIKTGKLESSYTINLSLLSSSDIMRFFLLIDAMAEMNRVHNNNTNLTINLDYMPYARQDRYCAPGQSFALRSFLFLLEATFSKTGTLNTIINLIDVHSEVVQTEYENIFYEGCKINFISQLDAIKEDFVLVEVCETTDLFIAPDEGAFEKTVSIAQHFNKSVIRSDKTRNPKTGYITSTILNDCDFKQAKNLGYDQRISDGWIASLKNKIEGNVITICDDICDGGMTFNLLAQEIKKYNPKQMNLIITHGIYSKGMDTLQQNYDNIYTINHFQTNQPKKVKYEIN